MDELKSLIEILTVDILLIGAITLMALIAAVRLSLALIGGVMSPTLPRLVEKVGHILVPKLMGDGKPGWVGIAPLVLAAAMVGIVVNLTADEILEDESRVRWLSAGKVKLGEDDIKVKAVDKLKNLQLEKSQADKLQCHMPQNEKKNKAADEREKERRRATAFVQHAYVSLFYDEEASRFSLIRTELLFVKLLRVLWLDVLFVFGCGILGALIGAWQRDQRRSRLLAAAGLFVVASVMSALLLSAWKEQSGRYYLKLVHAYIQTKLADDKLIKKSCPSASEVIDRKGNPASGQDVPH